MEPATPATQDPLNFIRPAIAGGLFWGALTAIPYLNLGNAVCCLWIQCGGAIAAILLNRQKPGALKYGDGALVGVMTGLCGTVVSAILDIPMQIVNFTPANAAAMQKEFTELLKSVPNLPPDYERSIAPLFTPGFSMSRLLMSVITFSIIGGLFSMIGGILAVALMKRHRGAEKG